ncbi:MAG: DEAD/DEAH box helicase, partial [Gemmatimonadaceae bacterium]
WGGVRQFRMTREQWLSAPEPADREIAQMLLGAQPEFGYFAPGSGTRRYIMDSAALDTTLRRMCETGRCRLRPDARVVEPTTLTWDSEGIWSLRLAVTPSGVGDAYQLEGYLERSGDRMSVREPLLLTSDGFMVSRGKASWWIHHGAFALVVPLRAGAFEEIPRADAMDLLAELYALPKLPLVELPPELEEATMDVEPTPLLALRGVASTPWSASRIDAVLSFDYAGTTVPAASTASGVMQGEGDRFVRRHRSLEDSYVRRLEQAGFRWEFDYALGRAALRIAEGRVADAAVSLVGEGWLIEIDGESLRTPGPLSIEVHSGIDWFDLDASVDFGGVSARLPELLAALRRGDRLVKLSDNSLGMIEDGWLERAGLLAATGTMVDGRLRFSTRQLGVLDVLLSALPPADTDAAFEHARQQLHRFEGVQAADAPPGFIGTLREYQREGLGWLHFLRKFGFGGCLADDMGLGKTVQVLALLESRRAEGAGPSLVVVPRSLVFNWEQEAARFTPQLRVLVHRGPERARTTQGMLDYDVVLTTYGTLRLDVAMLRELEFDYVVLDEAQAIKNAGTASAKAARLVRARHRIAMSGTPVENRLQELWSLLEFLNPGMLGKASVFATLAKQLGSLGNVAPKRIATSTPVPAPVLASDSPNDDPDSIPDGEVDVELPSDDGSEPSIEVPQVLEGDAREASRALLARAVRPYILRRTKGQVAPELPERLEQTLMVDLSPTERTLYNELRDHYRNSLLGRIREDGVGKHRMHVLEALLRLRQVACHPGLVDPSRRTESSSKLDLLVTRVSEAIAEEHKVLVFSQFTSLLALVRTQLDAAGIVYEYLDGDTKDRKQPVERFQTDPDCRVFLVSLKAGGVGLNLTAAEYVYLLDPWWNPAVEAQAIDRAHRIGQTRRVFASRLIARDTVEEKVLALQERKRDLADAIIRADESLVSSLGKEELEMLLG